MEASNSVMDKGFRKLVKLEHEYMMRKTPRISFDHATKYYSSRHEARVEIRRAKQAVKYLFITASVLAFLYVILFINALVIWQ